MFKYVQAAYEQNSCELLRPKMLAALGGNIFAFCRSDVSEATLVPPDVFVLFHNLMLHFVKTAFRDGGDW